MIKFVLNEKVPFEEGLDCEFKSLAGAHNPVDRIRDYVDVYVVAYLNRGIEGSIYWGITDRGKAVGVSLVDTRARDNVRQAIDGKLRSIKPIILTTAYEIVFLELFETADAASPIPDRCIVQVKVNSVSPRQVYFTGSNEAFIKTHSGREQLIGNRLTELQRAITEKQKGRHPAAEVTENEQVDQEKQEVNPPASEAPEVKVPEAPVDSTPFLNPYNAAVAAIDDMFKGREAEIGHLRAAIQNGTHTAIFGLQRMGKTSLVKETLRRIDENCLFVEVDLQRYAGERITYDALLSAIATRIADALRDRGISDRDVQDIDESMDEILSEAKTTQRMLEDYERILMRICKAANQKIVLFLDEFSELCQTIDENAELLRNNPSREAHILPKDMFVDVPLMRWFSHLMRTEKLLRKMVFIFAVRPFVAEYDADTQLQILKLVSPMTLHHLGRPAAKALMVEPVKDKIKYGAESIDYLCTLTAGHPYLIQFFLREIVDRIQQDGRSCIEKHDITRFEEEVISAEEVYDGQFVVLDSDYSVESVRSSAAAKKGRGVLAVIAHLGEQQGDDGWVPYAAVRDRLTRHHMQEPEILNILAKLRRAGIIEERKVDEEKLEYRVSIPLLRKRYVRQNMYQRHFPPRRSRL